MTIEEKNKWNALRLWLNSKKNYQQGLMIMMAYSDNKTIIDSLNKHENAFLLEKSIRAMYTAMKETIHKPESVVPEKEAATATAPILTDVHSKVDKPKASSADLKKIGEMYTAIAKLMKERGVWHWKMCDIAYDENDDEKENLSELDISRRYELILMIMAHQKKIREHYDAIEQFELTGILTLPAGHTAEAVVPLTKEQAYRKLKNSTAPNLTKVTGKLIKGYEELKDYEAMAKTPGLRKLIEKLKGKLEEWELKKKILETEKQELETLLSE